MASSGWDAIKSPARPVVRQESLSSESAAPRELQNAPGRVPDRPESTDRGEMSEVSEVSCLDGPAEQPEMRPKIGNGSLRKGATRSGFASGILIYFRSSSKTALSLMFLTLLLQRRDARSQH